MSRSSHRSRPNTAHSFADRDRDRGKGFDDVAAVISESRPALKHRTPSYKLSEFQSTEQLSNIPARPAYGRSATFDVTSRLRQDQPPAIARPSRIPSESLAIRTGPSPLRQGKNNSENVFGDQDDSVFYSPSSPDQSYGDRSISPATSHESGINIASTASMGPSGRKGPPPPPPSRAKKPPPPPPPAKRSLLV